MDDFFKNALIKDARYIDELESAYKMGQSFFESGRINLVNYYSDSFMKNYSLDKQQAEELINEVIQKIYVELNTDVSLVSKILQEHGVDESSIDRYRRDNAALLGVLLYSSIINGYFMPAILILSEIGKKNIINIVRNIDRTFVSCRMSTEQIFGVLTSVPVDLALEVIKKIDCTAEAFDALCSCIEKHDKDKFIATIYENKIDVINISTECTFIKEFFLVNAIANKVVEYLINGKIQEYSPDAIKRSIQRELVLYSELENEESLIPFTFDETEGGASNGADESPIIQNYNLLQRKCELLYNTMTPLMNSKEWEILNRVVENPIYKIDTNALSKSLYDETGDSPDTLDSDDADDNNNVFTLPDDYFNQPEDPEGRISLGDIRSIIKDKGAENFKNFIDYLASEELIKNNLQTKNSLAYRLTGRMKPNNLLDKIKWEKDFNFLKLYYIVKVFYDDNGRIGMNRNNKTRQTSRYKRMEDFLDFIPITQNPSSRAESVAEEFKKKMEEFFGKEISK